MTRRQPIALAVARTAKMRERSGSRTAVRAIVAAGDKEARLERMARTDVTNVPVANVPLVVPSELATATSRRAQAIEEEGGAVARRSAAASEAPSTEAKLGPAAIAAPRAWATVADRAEVAAPGAVVEAAGAGAAAAAVGGGSGHEEGTCHAVLARARLGRLP